jgi:hypothetical protein
MTFSKLLLPMLLLAATAFPQDSDDGQSVAPNQQPSAQQPSAPQPQQPGQTQEPPDKRVFGVLPNYRTANETAVYTPITAKQKFTIGAKDSFDYPLFLLSAALAGLGQLSNQNPSFGQGLAGYGRRLGTGFADQAIGNMMTESIFPSILHEDPRYFRRGYGTVKSRIWYAATRVFVTKTDAGNTRFNFSEVLGNATGVAISDAYYPDQRNVTDNVLKLGEQIGIDSFSQVLKEFWPDVKHRFFQHHSQPDASSAPDPSH